MSALMRFNLLLRQCRRICFLSGTRLGRELVAKHKESENAAAAKQYTPVTL